MAELMEETKKKRSAKGRHLTRRIGELRTAYTRGAAKEEVLEKIGIIKLTFDELGYIQDEVLDSLGDIDWNHKADIRRTRLYTR